MRILQVTDGFPPEQWGGAERFCSRLSEWLLSVGVEVQVAAPSQRGPADGPPRRPLHKVGPKYLRKLLFDYVSPSNAGRLKRIITEFRPDIVHGHNIFGISSQLFRVASQLVPTVVTLHGYWPIDVFTPMVSNGQLRYPWRQQLFAPWVRLHRAIHRHHLGGTVLVSPSRYLAERLSDVCGYRDIRLIPNGIEIPAQTTRYEPNLLFVGRIVAEKGLHTVLEPLVELAHRTEWSVDVVGDGPLRRHLEPKGSGLRFHGSTDPAPFYQAASIVVVPSIWPENLPYVVLEAMSHGIPVLASDIGGIPELVEDRVTGFLFDPGDSANFAASLGKLTANRRNLPEMGRAARQRVAAEFTWDTVGQCYLQLYREVMTSPHPRSALGSSSSSTVRTGT